MFRLLISLSLFRISYGFIGGTIYSTCCYRNSQSINHGSVPVQYVNKYGHYTPAPAQAHTAVPNVYREPVQVPQPSRIQYPDIGTNQPQYTRVLSEPNQYPVLVTPYEYPTTTTTGAPTTTTTNGYNAMGWETDDDGNVFIGDDNAKLYLIQIPPHRYWAPFDKDWPEADWFGSMFPDSPKYRHPCNQC